MVMIDDVTEALANLIEQSLPPGGEATIKAPAEPVDGVLHWTVAISMPLPATEILVNIQGQ